MKSALKFAAAMAFGLGVAGFGSNMAGARELTKVRVSTIPIMDTAPMEAARALGFFKDEGLEVDTTPSAGGAVGLPALAAGQVQFVHSNTVSIILGNARGLGFKIIAGGSTGGGKPPHVAGLVAKPDSDIKSGADLKGRKLAVNTRSNVIWLYANAWVDKNGGDASSVTYLEVPFPQMIDAVTGGGVDAAFVVDPFYTAAVSAGKVKNIGWPYESAPAGTPIGVFATSEDYMKAHPDVVAAFIRAYDKGMDWIIENQGSKEWIKLISGYTRLSPEQLSKLQIPGYQKKIPAKNLKSTIDLMVKYGLLDKPIDPKQVVAKEALAE